MTRVTRALLGLALTALTLPLLACPPQNLPQPVPPSDPAVGYEPPAASPASTPVAVATPDAASAPVTAPALVAAGGACTTGGDCVSGICEGQGCSANGGVCATTGRACTYDIQAYCGCDGQSFQASGSCPGARYLHRGACETGGTASADPTPRADGASCQHGADCASGVCEGKGCGADAPGVCVAASRRCTRDRRSFCGCDGATFAASGTCPGRRYGAAGACPR